MKRNLFGPSAWRWNSKYYGKPFGTYPSAPAGGTSVYTTCAEGPNNLTAQNEWKE